MKRVICGLMAVAMLLGLAACDSSKEEDKSTGEKEGLNSVVAVYNGTEITREDIGAELIDTEKDIVTTYIQSVASERFFKDIDVSDTEVEVQFQLVKQQVGDEQWPLYLTYYGGGSEESFREQLKVSLKQEKLITTKSENIEVSDEEVESAYNENPNLYNIAVLDVIFFGSVEDLNKAKELNAQGKTLEEIAEEMSLSISENEHTRYDTEGLTWDKKFEECNVGDVITSSEDSGSLVLGVIKQLNAGLENDFVKEELIKDIKYDKGYELARTEFIDFLKGQEVEIFGEKVSLYEEESSEENLEEENSDEGISNNNSISEDTAVIDVDNTENTETE